MCECGDFYIGESRREIGISIKKHKSTCEHEYFTKSPVSEHVWKEGSHIIQWDDVQLLDCSYSMIERKLKKLAIYINMPSKNLAMNRDTGMQLSPTI